MKIIKHTKHLLLCIAGCILILHSLVAHQHTNDIVGNSEVPIIEKNQSFKDFIKIMFLPDLGEGHMDNFSVEDGTNNVDFTISTSNISFDIIDILIFSKVENINLVRLHHSIEIFSPPNEHLTSKSKRGPPIFV